MSKKPEWSDYAYDSESISKRLDIPVEEVQELKKKAAEEINSGNQGEQDIEGGDIARAIAAARKQVSYGSSGIDTEEGAWDLSVGIPNVLDVQWDVTNGDGQVDILNFIKMKVAKIGCYFVKRYYLASQFLFSDIVKDPECQDEPEPEPPEPQPPPDVDVDIPEFPPPDNPRGDGKVRTYLLILSSDSKSEVDTYYETTLETSDTFVSQLTAQVLGRLNIFRNPLEDVYKIRIYHYEYGQRDDKDIYICPYWLNLKDNINKVPGDFPIYCVGRLVTVPGDPGYHPRLKEFIRSRPHENRTSVSIAMFGESWNLYWDSRLSFAVITTNEKYLNFLVDNYFFDASSLTSSPPKKFVNGNYQSYQWDKSDWYLVWDGYPIYQRRKISVNSIGYSADKEYSVVSSYKYLRRVKEIIPLDDLVPSIPNNPIFNDEEPEMSCDCCVLLQRIERALKASEMIETGVDIPNRLVTPYGTGVSNYKNYSDLIEAHIAVNDHLGIHPFEVEIADINAAKEGEQKLSEKFINATGFAQRLMKVALEENGDSATRLNLLVRLAWINSQMLNLLVIVNEAVKGIFQFLNVPFKENIEQVDMPFDATLVAREKLKGFSKKDLSEK